MNFHFDTVNGQIQDESRRYLMMRTDVLMGLFDKLPDIAREQALCSLGHSVADFGRDSVQAYAAKSGASEDVLLRTMQDAAASLGWGRWTFNRTSIALQLSVRNSPFAASASQKGKHVCHAIVGMLQGLSSVLYPDGALVHELSCAAVTGGDQCKFEACACQS
jgi:predicted hydrocarbon binding protein